MYTSEELIKMVNDYIESTSVVRTYQICALIGWKENKTRAYALGLQHVQGRP